MCGSVVVKDGNVFLYIDETGNTGARFLEASQPLFMSAAMVTKVDFDAVYSDPWNALLKAHNLDALHASSIGPVGIEKLSPDLVRILDNANARFCLSRVEKIYALAANVHQVIFDPAENAASDRMFVTDPGIRLTTVVEIARHMRIKVIGSAFEACLFQQSKPEQRQETFAAGCAGLVTACESPHARPTQSAIARVARWASENPSAFSLRLTGPAEKGRHPNLICFNNLVHGAQKIFAEWRVGSCTIKHDRQHQYHATIKFWQELWGSASPGNHALPSGEVRQYQALPNAEIHFEASNQSPGLQAVDACLWIVNRMFQRKPIKGSARHLLERVISRAELSDYSIEGAKEKIAT